MYIDDYKKGLASKTEGRWMKCFGKEAAKEGGRKEEEDEYLER